MSQEFEKSFDGRECCHCQFLQHPCLKPHPSLLLVSLHSFFLAVKIPINGSQWPVLYSTFYVPWWCNTLSHIYTLHIYLSCWTEFTKEQSFGDILQRSYICHSYKEHTTFALLCGLQTVSLRDADTKLIKDRFSGHPSKFLWFLFSSLCSKKNRPV